MKAGFVKRGASGGRFEHNLVYIFVNKDGVAPGRFTDKFDGDWYRIDVAGKGVRTVGFAEKLVAAVNNGFMTFAAASTALRDFDARDNSLDGMSADEWLAKAESVALRARAGVSEGAKTASSVL